MEIPIRIRRRQRTLGMPVRQRERDDDAALMSALADGCHDALEELYQRYGGAASSLARHVTRNETIADDIVQDVFVRLWERPERFDASRGSVRAFLMLETRGRSVDRIRREEARRKREDREQMLRGVEPVDDVEHQMWEALLNTQLHQAICALTDDERRAIELAYFCGYTYKEVAQLLVEPEGTIKSRIRSGLHRLRFELQKQGVSDAWLDQ